MNKKIKSSISCLLACMTLAFTACVKKGGSLGNESQVIPSEYFVKNGSTEYKILLPENATEVVEFAAQELTELVKKATGASLTSVIDCKNLPSGKYISLGDTSLLKDSGMCITHEELGMQGYKIKLVNDDIILGSMSGEGVLYAAYELMEKYFDYRYYCRDVMRLTEKKTAELLNLDIIDVPDIGYRCSGSNEIDNISNLDNRRRLRLQTLYDGWGGMYAHTYFKIMPPETYQADHADWYSPDGQNLCLTNIDRDVFTDNLKTIIEGIPNAPFVQIGQTDTFVFCDCKDCKDKIAEWERKGANSHAATSAIMMEFSNDIATRIDAWIQEEHPERKDLRLVTFAYQATRQAPAVQDKITKEWTLLDPSLKAVKNLSVMMVPYNAVMNYDFTHETNSSIMAQFDSWKVATDSLFIWMYDFNFDFHIQPFFASFGALSGDFKVLKDYGTEWVFIERGSTSSNQRGINFEIMKDFVCANLLWDTTLKTEDLIDEFMIAYYKDAAAPLKEYLNLMMMKQAEFAANGYYLYTFDRNFNTSKFWSYGFLKETCMGLFEEAYSAIEFYKDYDYETYEILKERISLETFWVRYLLVSIYPYEFVDVEQAKAELIADMRKVGVGNNSVG